MIEWRNLYRGMIMGASDIVPGVSGGTIAVVLGIYERFIEAINGVFTKEWKRHFAFLIPLGVGVVFAMWLLAGAINWAFEYYPNQVQFLFLGLIAGVIPLLVRKSEYKQTFGGTHYILFILATLFVASMAFFSEGSDTSAMTSFDAKTYILLFFSGWLASSAMILPGISGSFLLLLVGMYPTFTYAIEELVIDALIPLGLGIALGLIIMSKILTYLFHRFYYQTYALIIGLVIGSLVVIFPGFESESMRNVLSAIAFILGLLVAYGLGKIEHKE
ncbi:DUF368 domain-containing protein [Tenuibacillus multivorans]|uniref:Putative membrane protein n=1 Tax=Tenuibacillus multivorans TaxID=237069 RepID=A0A1H0B8F2_9BACI|nr:DUF368 domain-containing protein [Tenuibacillus multivorans]GEL78602.1 DUF368 domain-containing protein [Tenuibacillus multivorans]SDN41940.1 putative membrane protein [Tenuibacillus multivorans]